MKYLSATFAANIDGSLEIDTDTVYELVAAIAGEAGFESFESTSSGLVGYVQETLFDKEILDSALTAFPLEGVSVTYQLQEVEEKNWNENWEREGFEPIVVSGKCVIHDVLHPAEDEEGMMDVMIDAKMAFGTGCHSTTQLMVKSLLNLDLKGKRVLDCGCGTGILGIVAAKAGAQEVVGYDIDEWSVENTRHNARLNNVENIEVLTGNVKVLSHVNGLFDVVLANINRNILLQDMPEWREVMASDGTLIISGFYENDAAKLIACAQGLGLSVISTSSDGDWSLLIFSTSSES